MKVESGFNDDFLDILRALVESGTEFLVVGAHALALHGVARSTGDLDVWVHSTPENAQRVIEALEAFGAPIQAHGVTLADFETPENVYQVGLAPRRIDLIDRPVWGRIPRGLELAESKSRSTGCRFRFSASMPYVGTSRRLAGKRISSTCGS